MYKEITNDFIINSKCNVFLKDGTEYLGKDTAQSNASMDSMIGFWDGELFVLIPYDLIKRIEVYKEK